MRSNDVFPSDFFRASDVERMVLFTMSHVDMREIGDDHRPVLFFTGQQKGLVLNKTNWGTLAEAYGDESDEWSGKQIVLYQAMVSFQGKMVPAIRVRKPKPSVTKTQEVNLPPKPQPLEMMDDEIPF
jgi:hypothetical protein